MPLERREEERLIQQASQGDTTAFNTLVEHYFKVLTGYVGSRLHWREPDSQDVIQEIWMYAWRKMPTFDPLQGKSFYTWLMIWANICITRHCEKYYIRQARETQFPQSGDDPDSLDWIWQLGNPDPGYDRVDHAEELLDALRVVFQSGGYPWQLICYGFIKFLPDWKPRIIADRLGNSCTLQQLAGQLKDEYILEMGVPEHLADCPACAAQVRKARHFNDLLDRMTAHRHGAAVRLELAAKQLAKAAEEERDPAQKTRLQNWLWHIRDKAFNAFQLIFGLPEEPDGLRGLGSQPAPSLSFGFPEPLSAGSRTSVNGRPDTDSSPDPGTVDVNRAQRRITFRFAVPPSSPERLPIVLLIADEPNLPPRRSTATRLRGSTCQVVFDDVPPGEYLVLTEPVEGSP